MIYLTPFYRDQKLWRRGNGRMCRKVRTGVAAPTVVWFTSGWRFTLLECAGCGHIVLREVVDFGSPEDTVIRYNPSPTSRKVPHWVFDMSVGLRGGRRAASLGDLLMEIYQTVFGGHFRLAIMGVRALIEQVMIHKVGDKGSFLKNLDAFQTAGYVSLVRLNELKTDAASNAKALREEIIASLKTVGDVVNKTVEQLRA